MLNEATEGVKPTGQPDGSAYTVMPVITPNKPLSQKHRAFIREYRLDRNATRAYRLVFGASDATAGANGFRLLERAEILAEIERQDIEQAESLGIDLDVVLIDAWHVLVADARELVELRVEACRHCYGEGHLRQRTAGEYNRDFERWTAMRSKVEGEEFDGEGGIGFDPHKPPADDCPECFGAGLPREVFHDTRSLSRSAAALYNGVRRTKDGISVLLRSKDNARETLMKHMGGYLADNEQKRTPLTDALATFVKQIHADEAGKLQHTAAPLRVVPPFGG